MELQIQRYRQNKTYNLCVEQELTWPFQGTSQGAWHHYWVPKIPTASAIDESTAKNLEKTASKLDQLDVLFFRGTLSFQISNKKGLGLRVVMAVILQQWQTRIREELLPAKQHCQENLRAAKVAATAPKIGQDIPKPATASRNAISEGQKGNANLLIFKHSIPEVWLIFEDSPYHIFGCPHQLTSCHNSPYIPESATHPKGLETWHRSVSRWGTLKSVGFKTHTKRQFMIHIANIRIHLGSISK